MERQGILYLRNRTLPSLDDFIIHCRLNDFSLMVIDEEDYDPYLPSQQKPFELIIIDYPLRSRGRVKEMAELRREKDIPLIMLMTSVKEAAQIEAFTNGADDIVDRESCSGNVITLINRIGNLIKICGKVEETTWKSWKAGQDLIAVNSSGRLVRVNGSSVHLTPTEWNILQLLSDRSGLVVSRETILARCFEYQYEGYDRSIDAHIKNLRKKTPGCIETMRGVGYRFSGKEI